MAKTKASGRPLDTLYIDLERLGFIHEEIRQLEEEAKKIKTSHPKLTWGYEDYTVPRYENR